MSLTWNEILERAKQKNHTVICEVEKIKNLRCFKILCNFCKIEKIVSIVKLSNECVVCSNSQGHDKDRLKRDFVHKAKEIHAEKYIYDFAEYVNIKTKIKIYCNKCNEIFMQTPAGHLFGYGCRNCGWISGHEKLRSTTEEFIIKAKKVHNNKFDYNLVRYKNSLSKVQIKCNECKIIFLQSPNDHLNSYGCKKCADEKLRSNTEEFISKAKAIHGDNFNYDLVKYLRSNSFVKIKCNKCNELSSQTPASHLNMKHSVCNKCSKLFQRLSTEEWIIRAKSIHGDLYDYALAKYSNNKGKITIKCNKCNNVFSQRSDHHIKREYGCPVCNDSKGEKKVAKYLYNKNELFSREHGFKNLRNKNPLKFDFYLSDLNLLIEYDGDGHYKACFGSTPEEKQKNFEDCQRRDKIKDEWARKNNIPLLRIPYWDFDRIEELIDAFILQHTKKKEIKQLSLEI